TNQVYIVPPLVIPCPSRISGTIAGCNSTATNAFVYASWGTGTYFHYCQTGSFNIPVPPNTLISFKIYEGSTTYTESVTSGAVPNTIDIGNIILCNNGIQPDNSFYVTGNGHLNELIQIDTTSTGAERFASTAGFNIVATGVNHSTGLSAMFYFQLTDSLQGSYLCDSTWTNQMDVSFNYEDYNSFYHNAHATVVLNSVQYAGGRVKGTFSGTLIPADTSGQVGNVTITNGKFNVTRTQ
ncbi:MAG: hypothetical protein ABI855_18080, partial [Bacteroidota bacterium]